MPAKPAQLNLEQNQLLAELGERVRLARLRRRLTAEHLAEQAGITRMTLYRVERGEPAPTIGTLIKVMGVLGMDGEFAQLARDDSAGRTLQDERLAQRHPASRSRIRVDRYPQLQQLAWHVSPSSEISSQEAFALYERNWRHVDETALQPREKQLVRRLTRTVGKGVMLV